MSLIIYFKDKSLELYTKHLEEQVDTLISFITSQSHELSILKNRLKELSVSEDDDGYLE